MSLSRLRKNLHIHVRVEIFIRKKNSTLETYVNQKNYRPINISNIIIYYPLHVIHLCL